MIVYCDEHTILCSHAEAFGEAVVNGRTWRWELLTCLGIGFLNADGSERKRYPAAGHPIWQVVEQWDNDRRATT